MYEKKIETLDDLLDSDVIYGTHQVSTFALSIVPYPELMKFVEHKRLKEDCTDLRKCVERMITKRDIASFDFPNFANYFSKNLGTVDVGKIICSLDETVMSGGAVIVFKKGNLLLDKRRDKKICALEE
jgi:hypothetical protein